MGKRTRKMKKKRNKKRKGRGGKCVLRKVGRERVTEF